VVKGQAGGLYAEQIAAFCADADAQKQPERGDQHQIDHQAEQIGIHSIPPFAAWFFLAFVRNETLIQPEQTALNGKVYGLDI
jgi:hypothetical protein